MNSIFIRATYDPEVDATYLTLDEKASYYVSKAVGVTFDREQFIVDFDDQGNIIGVEILNLTKTIREYMD